MIFCVPEGTRVDLSKWPTHVERAYKSKKKYHKLLDHDLTEPVIHVWNGRAVDGGLVARCVTPLYALGCNRWLDDIVHMPRVAAEESGRP